MLTNLFKYVLDNSIYVYNTKLNYILKFKRLIERYIFFKKNTSLINIFTN